MKVEMYMGQPISMGDMSETVVRVVTLPDWNLLYVKKKRDWNEQVKALRKVGQTIERVTEIRIYFSN